MKRKRVWQLGMVLSISLMGLALVFLVMQGERGVVAAAMPPGDPLPRIACTGSYTATIYAEGLSSPDGLTFTSDGRLYVAEEASGEISQVGASGIITPLISGLNNPEGLTLDSDLAGQGASVLVTTISRHADVGRVLAGCVSPVLRVRLRAPLSRLRERRPQISADELAGMAADPWPYAVDVRSMPMAPNRRWRSSVRTWSPCWPASRGAPHEHPVALPARAGPAGLRSLRCRHRLQRVALRRQLGRQRAAGTGRAAVASVGRGLGR